MDRRTDRQTETEIQEREMIDGVKFSEGRKT